jgi:hypothetical protein
METIDLTNMDSRVLFLEIGMRIELHPACDAWMMGDRYGEIIKLGKKWIHLKMDRSGKIRKIGYGNILRQV